MCLVDLDLKLYFSPVLFIETLVQYMTLLAVMFIEHVICYLFCLHLPWEYQLVYDCFFAWCKCGEYLSIAVYIYL